MVIATIVAVVPMLRTALSSLVQPAIRTAASNGARRASDIRLSIVERHHVRPRHHQQHLGSGRIQQVGSSSRTMATDGKSGEGTSKIGVKYLGWVHTTDGVYVIEFWFWFQFDCFYGFLMILFVLHIWMLVFFSKKAANITKFIMHIQIPYTFWMMF